MFLRLLVLLITIPLVETLLIIQVSKYIGFGWTFFLIILTAVLGSFLTKSQGFRVVSEIKFEINSGRIPGNTLLEGFLILIGGILLLTPGFITDTLGFSLLIPMTRQWYKRKLLNLIRHLIATKGLYFYFRK